MGLATRIALLTSGLGLALLLAGCPGMPGVPGGAGASQQQLPPGLQPPPGLRSGGARTLMGATVVPPDNAILLVKFGGADQWRSCRRIMPLDASVLLEGINYDGRDKGAEKDVNQLVPLAGATITWKYEPKPTPPPRPKAQAKPGRRGR